MKRFITQYAKAKYLKHTLIYDIPNNRYMVVNHKRWLNWGGCVLIKKFI